MGNPISDLWGTVQGIWHSAIGGYNKTWRDMYDAYNLSNFEVSVRDSITALGQAFEAESVLAAVSAADTVQIGRDLAVSTWQALWSLRMVQMPDLAGWAQRRADELALIRALEAERWSWARIVHEALDRATGDLRERIALDVAIAQEHADMVTRVAIEANDRVLMVQHEALDRQHGDQAEAQARVLMIQHEALDRQQADAQVLRYAQSIPGLEDQRAAAGYDPTLTAHATGLTRLLDTAIAHEPLIASVVSRLAGWLVDLAEVDDPLIRLAAQLILKELIDRFGLDTALGGLLGDLLGPVLGGGPPKTLQAVTAQVGNRLNGLESGLAALAPLAPEADDLHELGTAAFDVALLGYLGFAAADPVAAADDTAVALETVIGPLLGPLRSLLGMP